MFNKYDTRPFQTLIISTFWIIPFSHSTVILAKTRKICKFFYQYSFLWNYPLITWDFLRLPLILRFCKKKYLFLIQRNYLVWGKNVLKGLRQGNQGL